MIPAKPMLAATLDPFKLSIEYPCMASYKLDGVRCLIIDGVALSRSLKPIPSEVVQRLLGGRTGQGLEGLDGELIVGDPAAKDVFNRTSSAVMSKAKKITVGVDLQKAVDSLCFYVFDRLPLNGSHQGYKRRYEELERFFRNNVKIYMKLVPHRVINSEKELLAFEASAVEQGYEGIMIRSMDCLYKFGRSTLKEGHLMKLKRFHDGEAVVLDVNPLMHNANEAQVNELGQKERPVRKAGMRAEKMLGSMMVRDVKTGVIFDVGSGFSEEDRIRLWINKPLGKTIKYKSQLAGVKDKPRFPVFMGFRDKKDAGE